MTIYRLAQQPHLAAQTAALMTVIWPSHYGPDGDGDAMVDVQNRIAEDRAAITVKDDTVVGTVALDANSFGSQGEGPWLVGLCTSPHCRGQGIATALTTWAMGSAHQEGHAALFATTKEAAGIMRRLGWRRMRQITDQSGTWTVWRVMLSGPRA
ncbi:MAG: GNAT family N-acetyltransferase [Pseudomonadota bacterium]